jgi:hypothetical protein
MNALQALQLTPLQFTGQWYPRYYSWQIIGIDNYPNDPATNSYWIFCVNQKPASAGVDQTILPPGAVTTWIRTSSQDFPTVCRNYPGVVN